MSGPSAEPRVTVVTPVYNGAAFLAQCIDSVRAQTYGNWRYVIVDNKSTDGTAEIAAEYARRDPRISVVTNDEFLPVIENHNRALDCVPADSQYCKPLMADDWLMPECIAKMIAVAESFPSVGLVGCYAFDGVNVLWDGHPYRTTPTSGRDVCRRTLLDGVYVFGTPSSVLIAGDVLRERRPFYDPRNTHADYESCLRILRDRNFGFVYQVLVFNRIHPGSVTSRVQELDSLFFGGLEALVRYGPVYLDPEELAPRLAFVLDRYYQRLAKNVLRLRGSEFWRFHRRKLGELGYSLSRARLMRATIKEVLSAVCRPGQALDGLRTWWPKAAARTIETKRPSP